jgi:hypothetical protein
MCLMIDNLEQVISSLSLSLTHYICICYPNQNSYTYTTHIHKSRETFLRLEWIYETTVRSQSSELYI